VTVGATEAGGDVQSLDPVVAHALRIVRSCVEPRQVLLFGSRNDGRFRPDSDLDLIVVADAGTRQGRLERELRESLGLMALPVDVLLRTSEQMAGATPTSFLGSIREAAVEVYRSPEAGRN
jgi:predicted nucleotidyltransferase